MYLRYLRFDPSRKSVGAGHSLKFQESVMSSLRVCNSTFRTYAVVRAAVAACLLLSLSVVGHAQAGSLDPTFGHHGIFTTNFATCWGGMASIALQSDGKILVGGQ